jgi:hypothetical protein
VCLLAERKQRARDGSRVQFIHVLDDGGAMLGFVTRGRIVENARERLIERIGTFLQAKT